MGICPLVKSPINAGFYSKDPILKNNTIFNRIQFIVFVCFLLSQGYVVPVLQITSQWALWPCLADICFVAFLIITIIIGRKNKTEKSVKCLQSVMLMFILVSCLSFLIVTILSSRNGRGIDFGLYQLYMLLKFYLMLWAAGKMPLNPIRLKIIHGTLIVLALWVVVVVALRYYLVDIEYYQLVRDATVVGPWAYSSLNVVTSILGYNHSYTAAQILLIIALCIQSGLKKQNVNIYTVALLAMGMIACFMTQSRTGLAVYALFAFMLVWRSYMVIIIAIFVVVLVEVISLSPIMKYQGDQVISRQMWFIGTNIDASVLSGRDYIWRDKANLLINNPNVIIFGEGFGMVAESYDNAHMQILHMILEIGIIGTTVILITAFKIIRLMKNRINMLKPMMACTIALIVSTVSQETFYPVPAFGWFMGFYFIGMRIAVAEKNLVNNETKRDKVLLKGF